MKKPTYITNPLIIEINRYKKYSKKSISRILKFNSFVQKPILMRNLKVRHKKVNGTMIESALYKAKNNPEKNLKILFYGWGGGFRPKISRMELSEIVKFNPNTGILMVNNPGTDNSDTLPDDIARRMAKTGSFLEFGKILAVAIEKCIKNYNHINIYGNSMGARTALAVAANINHKIDYISVTDPPGASNIGATGVFIASVIKEKRHCRKYAEHTNNPKALKMQEAYDEKNSRGIKIMAIKAMEQLYLDEPLALSRAGLRRDLQALIKNNNTKKIQINTPELSELNNINEITKIIKNISKKHPKIDLKQVLLKGQTHSLSVGGNAHTTGKLSTWL